MTLSIDTLNDVCWWSSNIQSASKKIHQSSPDVLIYTDVSNTGRGAQIKHGINTCSSLSKSKPARHIYYLERLAVKLALSSLFNSRSGIHVEGHV